MLSKDSRHKGHSFDCEKENTQPSRRTVAGSKMERQRPITTRLLSLRRVTTRVLGYWIDVFDSDETKTEEPFFILPVEDSHPKIERTPSDHVSSDKQNIPEGVFEAQLG